jgi:flagellar biosynthesis/type III secretory pathway chaperone
LSDTAIPGLSAALNAERTAMLGFIALLESEQAALMENRSDALTELSKQKTADALELNRLVEARRELLKPAIPNQNSEAVASWLGTHSRAELPAWHDIVALTQRAKQLNQVNGELIQMKLRRNQQTLTVLSNAVNKAGVYGRNGQPDFSPGSGRTLGQG